MNSKESVVWLDGYMKGITAVGASASNVGKAGQQPKENSNKITKGNT